jgi:hypothetical protein
VFHGHGLVLCNSSDWFLSSLCGGFKEANAREITLKDDYADGLEGLFEFCYRGTYTDCTIDTVRGLETAMKRFLQDARVFVVGDKYTTDGLVTHALNRVRGAVRYGLFQRTSDNSEIRRLLKWVVETVYLRQHVLGFEQETSDTEEDNEDGGEECLNEVEDTEVDADALIANEFEAGDLEALRSNLTSTHPLDRLRRIVVQVLVEEIWENNHAELEPAHTALLAKQVPRFGMDLAVAILKADKALDRD